MKSYSLGRPSPLAGDDLRWLTCGVYLHTPGRDQLGHISQPKRTKLSSEIPENEYNSLVGQTCYMSWQAPPAIRTLIWLARSLDMPAACTFLALVEYHIEEHDPWAALEPSS